VWSAAKPISAGKVLSLPQATHQFKTAATTAKQQTGGEGVKNVLE